MPASGQHRCHGGGASGTLVAETALKISTIVKFSQNVLLGVAAFAISMYWTYTQRHLAQHQAHARVIWGIT